MTIIAAIIVGLAVGVASGLLGAGGGILAVPALVYIVGMPTAQAVASSLTVGVAAPIAALAPRLRGDGLDWKVVMVIALGGMPSAWAGAFAGRSIPDHWLLLTFAVLMVVVASRMLFGKKPQPGSTDRPSWWGLRALGIGVLVGFLTGLLGVGGGFITVPALVLLLHQPIARAIGTSLAVALINSISALIAHAGAMDLDWRITLAFAAPAVLAALAAGRFSRRVSGQALNRGFAIMLFVIAFLTIAQVGWELAAA